jgi:hypothetical protein
VWIKSVVSSGFLSVRDVDDKWTYNGRIWTRDQDGVPTGPYSWEAFEIVALNRKKDADTHDLLLQLETLRSENERLKHEVLQLRPYKEMVTTLKGLLNQC